jgi:soluble lytic murein transglycosylase-like protein
MELRMLELRMLKLSMLHFGRRFRLSAAAALPVLALASFALSAPASAHRAHAYRHYSARRQALPMQADNVAPGIYNFAPSYPAPNSWGESAGPSGPLDGMAASAASAAGIPASLVERVIKRESGGNPRAVSSGNYGLMQIRLGTARAMGYSGSAEGLLDAQTNMTYAVRYLAGAYRAAGGNENRAVALYARGYYDVAKRQGFSAYASEAPSGFAPYPQFAEQTSEPFGTYDNAPTYRVRLHRHHAV